MRIPFLDLGRQHRALKAELLGAVERVLESSRFETDGVVAAVRTAVGRV